MADDPTMSIAAVDDSVVYLCDDTFNFTISGVFFILIFVLSVTGNGLLLCVLFVYENLKNVTNLFVLNVAFSDLVFTLTLPFWAVYYLHHWVFGDFFCKVMTAVYFVGLYSSIILLTALTVDRFITVVLYNRPSRVKRQRCAVGACVAAWVVSAAASLSNAFAVTVETDMNNFTLCEDFSEGPAVNLGYYLQVSLLFLFPFAIIVFCYSAILKKVLQSSSRRHRATVVVVLCIVAVFFVCWGPYHVLVLTATWYYPKECSAKERFEIAFNVCQILAYSHCCMNPLLYMLSRKLRRHLLRLVSCKKVEKWRPDRNRGNRSSTSVFQNLSLVAQISTAVLEMQPNT